jgi:hypothetical protein
MKLLQGILCVGCFGSVALYGAATGAVRSVSASASQLLRQPAGIASSQLLRTSRQGMRQFSGRGSVPSYAATPSSLTTNPTLRAFADALRHARLELRERYFNDSELRKLESLTGKKWVDINRLAEVITGDFNKDRKYLISGGHIPQTEAEYDRLLQKFAPEYLKERIKINGRYETYLEYLQRLLQQQSAVGKIYAPEFVEVKPSDRVIIDE